MSSKIIKVEHYEFNQSTLVWKHENGLVKFNGEEVYIPIFGVNPCLYSQLDQASKDELPDDVEFNVDDIVYVVPIFDENLSASCSFIFREKDSALRIVEIFVIIESQVLLHNFNQLKEEEKGNQIIGNTIQQMDESNVNS